ncbi:hypothetical protein JQK88_07085 [Mesorhizobium caraganae]|uniref:hypothetical protein n=1 Tax=Mesorhizobium caraganae TaxID=483206 RepID=UPI00177F5636|nr:hypothetical protein [Mesorhizobium caraganae]MBM2711015.1 hypothetical protein [Mesorhizobium caraganae]
MRTPDPIVAAEHLKAAGEDYGTLVFTSAVKADTAEGMTGLDISTANYRKPAAPSTAAAGRSRFLGWTCGRRI